jgi:hypothetical protein
MTVGPRAGQLRLDRSVKEAGLPELKHPDQSDDPWEAPDPALALALQQIRWYARQRDRARRAYRVNEILILVISASTTVAAALKATAWVTAVLAAGTVVLAGLYKVLDAQENWVAFGVAWTDLQVAANDYRLLPAEERDEEGRRQLVSKVNEIISADTGRWASRRRGLVADRTPK